MSLKTLNFKEENSLAKISERIKTLRLKADMTQEEFGKTFGIVKSTVSLYESGKSSPNDEIKKHICDYFDISLDYLVGRSDIENELQTSTGGYDNVISHWIGKTGLGNDEVAQKLGISDDLLSDYLQGNIPIPYQILITLSDLCEVSTDCLLGISDKSRNSDFDNVLPFRYNYHIAERIRYLCEQSIGTNSSFLESLLSLSNQEVYYLIEYGFVPHMDTIIKLADYFNVSTDYLLCQIDDQDEKALRSFRQLNADNKDIIVGEIKKYLKEQKYESVAVDETLKKAK